MTRDQMHNTLRYVREQLAEERGSDFSGVKALDLVLEELEQEPTDDYFRRMAEVVISQLRTDRDRLEDELAKLEQEPKTGHWRDINQHRYYDDGDIVTTKLRCSCCNEVVEWDMELLHKPYYCENCGARMVEPQESEGKE